MHRADQRRDACRRAHRAERFCTLLIANYCRGARCARRLADRAYRAKADDASCLISSH